MPSPTAWPPTTWVGSQNVPTLLATSTSVPQATLDALAALGVKTIHLLGGTASLSDGVLSALQGKGFTVDRIAGPDRFGTAAAIARAVPAGSIGTIDAQPTAVLSSGRSFPDSLAAGGIVYAFHYPQLLSEATTLPAATVVGPAGPRDQARDHHRRHRRDLARRSRTP